jgi:glutamate racemase
LKTVGVFDSGVGGLSVLRALLAELPGVRFIYVADSAYAPYG